MSGSAHHLALEIARLAAWLIVLAVVFLPLERFFAVSHRYRRRRELWQDIGLYFLSGIVPAIVLALPLAALATIGRSVLPPGYIQAVAALPMWVRLGTGFLIAEVGFYWGHRWSHQIPLLWRFHVLHHQPTYMNWLVNTRTHPVDLVFTRICGLFPIYFLGLAQADDVRSSAPALAATIAGTVWGFVIHANVRWRFGLLEKLVASPCFHHWHHSRLEPINRNFASMLPVLDVLFGTLHLPGSWPAHYGTDSSDPASPPGPAMPQVAAESGPHENFSGRT